jgi:hypothetical protein
MEKHFLRPLFAGCSQSHLSGDPLFKPLLANFALFATTLFLWTLMGARLSRSDSAVRSGSLSYYECNFVREADEVDKKEAGGKSHSRYLAN